MQETADTAGDSADELEGFSQRFKGAMSAAIAGLAVGVAGLASQIPVLGELFSGFGAILDALFFQVDQLLRPALSGITPILFGWANAIFEAEGATGDLLGVLTILGGILGSSAAALTAWSIKTAGVTATAGKFVAIVKSAVATISGFVSGSLAAAAAFGVFLGLLGVGVLEITGVLDAIQGLGRAIGNGLPQSVTDGITLIVGAFLGLFALLGGIILGFVQGTLEGGLEEGIDQAVARAQDVLDVFLGAWDRTLDRVQGKVSSFIQWLRGKLDQDIAGGLSVGDIAGSVGGVGTGGGGGGAIGAAVGQAVGGGGGGGGGSQIDGRQLSESTGRYRSDPGRRRGL